jgi:quercetin dioxygenase-like cupin family protein
MAISHAASGQLVDVQPLADKLADARTTALFKTGMLEVMRVVLPAHKTMPAHQVKGDMTIQCLEGEIDLMANGQTQRMKAGQLVWLAGGIDHALTALQDSSLLVTLVLQK